MPQQIHQVPLVRIASELDGQVVMEVGDIVLGNEIGYTGDRNRSFELTSLGNEPVGKLAAIAHSLDPYHFRIEPFVAAKRGLDTVQNVFCFRAILILKNGVGKALAVSNRTSIVHHQYPVAMRGISLRFEVKQRPLVIMGSAMYHGNKRCPFASLSLRRDRKECFDRQVVGPRETYWFNLCNLFFP